MIVHKLNSQLAIGNVFERGEFKNLRFPSYDVGITLFVSGDDDVNMPSLIESIFGMASFVAMRSNVLWGATTALEPVSESPLVRELILPTRPLAEKEKPSETLTAQARSTAATRNCAMINQLYVIR